MVALVAMVCCLAGPAPVLTVAGLDGRIHQPLKEAAGKPVAFIFVAHDCPMCNGYAPELARIARDFKGRAAVDIVYSEPRFTAPEARSHAKQYGLNSAGLFLDQDHALAAKCKVTVTPEAVVYDTSGSIAYSGRIDDLYISLGRQRLAATHHYLRTALNAVISHQKPNPTATSPVGCIIVWSQKS